MLKLKSIDYKAAMLLLLGAASPFVSPNIALPVALVVFSGMIIANKWFDLQQKPDLSAEIENEVKAIKNQMSGIMIKNAAKPEEMSKEFKRFF